MSKRGRASSPLAVVIAGFLWVPPSSGQPAPEPWQGLTKSEPTVCSGDQDIVIRNRQIEANGNAVVVSGNCNVKIIGSHIVAGGVAILVSGNGHVEISDSYIRGGGGAIVVSGNGDVVYSGNTLQGGVQQSGNAELEDRGGNKMIGGSVAAGTGVGIGASAVDVDKATMSIGPEGVAIQGGADDRISVGGKGVSVSSGDESVRVDGDAVRLRDGGTEAKISGDWRSVTGSVYQGGDTQRVLVELGATDTGGEIRLDLAGDVLFDFNSSAIRPDAAEQLAKVAFVIRQRAVGEVHLTGHTDSIGKEDYNIQLSRQRAAAVMSWLNEKEHIPANLMVGHGMGSKKPIAYNTLPDGTDNPEGRAKNRRVEFQFATK